MNLLIPIQKSLIDFKIHFGRNYPYSGFHYNYTLDRHSQFGRIDNICLEFRNDLICNEKRINKYINVFEKNFKRIFIMIDDDKMRSLEAATFRRLVSHLQNNTDLQNIDLMNLAGFCRNCLSKWMVEEGKKMDVSLDYEKVRSEIYGMDYSEWKKISKTD